MAVSTMILGTSPTELLIGEQNVQKAIIGFSLCNFHTASVKINVYVVPSGGTPQNSNLLLKEIDLAASDTCIFDGFKIILNNGEKLVATSDTASAVSAVISWHQF